MKTTAFYLKQCLLALSAGLLLVSCVKFQPEDLPEVTPDFQPDPDNAKIMKMVELDGYYPGTTFAQVTKHKEVVNGDTVERDIYLHVVVIGNDASGNIYKGMYVRDLEDPTHALNLSVDKTGLYNFYPVGQELYIRVTGLYYGRYNNLPQLGFRFTDDNGSVTLGRIPDVMFMQHVFKKGVPPTDPAQLPQPIEITSAAQLENNALYNQLVVLRNVQFAGDDVNEEFAPAPPIGTNPTSTNRYFSVNGTGSFALRTSSACRFFKRLVPAGVGDMVCIYAIYGTTQQFYLRGFEDLDLSKFEATADVNYPIFTASFSSDINNFKAVSVKGNATWTWGNYGGGCALIKGSNTSQEVNEDWLISDEIEIPERFNDVQFSFEQALNYMGSSPFTWYTVRYSTDYDPAKHSDPNQATWQNISVPSPHPGNSFTFVNSGNIDFSFLKGKKFRVAFVYKSDNSTMATWEVNKVKVIGNNK